MSAIQGSGLEGCLQFRGLDGRGPLYSKSAELSKAGLKSHDYIMMMRIQYTHILEW